MARLAPRPSAPDRVRPDHLRITTQLYFQGDEHFADEIASAVKPELIIAPKPTADESGRDVTDDFILDPA